MVTDSKTIFFVKRCFDLAQLGKNGASPNPIVGAVLVHNDQIIGEGYHKKHGTAHAEVNALASVKDHHKHLIPSSTIYVSLEPCCIFGSTPPCTNLIIKHKISKVVFACIDRTAGVLGKSINLLEEAGVEVTSGILEKDGAFIVQPRTVYTTQKRPYIILKYAVSQDGYMGKADQQIWMTNSFSKRLVHRWRSESNAIIVGTNTAELDNPQLTNRLFYGPSPLRIVLDRSARLSKKLNIFDGQQPTWVITECPDQFDAKQNLQIIQIDFDEHLLERLMTKLYTAKVGILIVEGGQRLLESFIQHNLWDEARVFETSKVLESGIKAPILNLQPKRIIPIKDDVLKVFYAS